MQKAPESRGFFYERMDCLRMLLGFSYWKS